MKAFWLTLTGLLLAIRLLSQNPGDLVDVLHYQINLKVTDFSGQQISGACFIKFKALQANQTQVKLELWNLEVDSVVAEDLGTYSYDGSIILAEFNSILSQTDTEKITVYYHGHPSVDPTGWGGFIFSSGIAYNLGVGFGANPHNLGKSWFPCVDTFTDRASYEYFITTTAANKATCSGYLVNQYPNPDNPAEMIHHWKLDEEIPTYLASVAVSNFVVIADTIAGLEKAIPVSHYLIPSLANYAGSFLHLPEALHAFEACYGPYQWPRIGYVSTTLGAMEHTCNIAFPTGYINGTLSGEKTMAHELAHAWFGNLITCETAEDMWINEGWASFLEEDFMEYTYGKQAAKDYARSRHALNIRTLHQEEGFLPLYGISNENTYSSTIYKKGADMAHSLRGYLGDSLFYAGLKQLFIDSAYQDISVAEFCDYLTANSGIDLHPFFDAHIYQPGWLHFSIDSTRIIPAGNGTAVQVYARQRKKDADNYLSQTRSRIGFLDEQWKLHLDWFTMNDSVGSQSYILDFDPVDIILDPEEEYMDATTDRYLLLKESTSGTLNEEFFKYEVNTGSDSAFVRVEQSWIAPDNFKNPHPEYILSNSRYWKIQGDIPSGFSGMFKFNYNNETTVNGLLDYTWFTYPMAADSLVLLYRENTSEDWQEISFIRQGLSRIGYLSTSETKKGEYTMAYRDRSLNINELIISKKITIYPNPASDSITVEKNTPESLLLQIFDESGRMVESSRLVEGKYATHLKLNREWSGQFRLRFTSGKKVVQQSSLIIQ